MEKYSKEWKIKKGAWIQEHCDGYKVHYIENGTEYAGKPHFTKEAAEEQLKEICA